MSTARLHALIDGVFAIAVTLLVLDLPVIHGSQDFGHRLVSSWPTYAAYLVSFASIGVVWIEHSLSMAASWHYLTRHDPLVYEAARPAMGAGARRALLRALAYLPAIILAPLVPCSLVDPRCGDRDVLRPLQDRGAWPDSSGSPD